MKINLYQEKVMVFATPVDFRKSITGLLGIITADNELNAQEGIYIFYNKLRDKIKILSWHKNGYIMLLKNLVTGKFPVKLDTNNKKMKISINELSWLLAGLEWQKMRHWDELPYEKFS